MHQILVEDSLIFSPSPMYLLNLRSLLRSFLTHIYAIFAATPVINIVPELRKSLLEVDEVHILAPGSSLINYTLTNSANVYRIGLSRVACLDIDCHFYLIEPILSTFRMFHVYENIRHKRILFKGLSQPHSVFSILPIY